MHTLIPIPTVDSYDASVRALSCGHVITDVTIWIVSVGDFAARTSCPTCRYEIRHVVVALNLPCSHSKFIADTRICADCFEIIRR